MEAFRLSEYLVGAIISPLQIPALFVLIRRWRHPVRKVVKATFVLLALLLLTNAIALWFWGVTYTACIFVTVVSPLLCWIVFLYCCEFKDGRILFTFVTALLLASIDQVIADTFTSFGSWGGVLIRIVICVVQTFFLYYVCREPYNDILDSVDKGWVSFSALPALLFVCLTISHIIPVCTVQSKENIVLSWVLSLTVPVVYIVIYYLVDTQKRQQAARQDNALLATQMRFLEQQTEQVLASDNQNRMFRHDVRHYIQQMQVSLEKQDREGVEKILQRMDEQVGVLGRQARWRRYTGNVILDLVLSQMGAEAEAEGIEYSVQLMIPDQLRVDTTELAVVLSNALENALDACRAMPPEEKREIKVFDSTETHQLFLSIRNTYCGAIEFDTDTGLPLPSGPGRGTASRSIAAFAKKYDAFLRYTAKDGWFSLSLLI